MNYSVFPTPFEKPNIMKTTIIEKEKYIELNTHLESPCPYHLGADISASFCDIVGRYEFDYLFFVVDANLEAAFRNSIFKYVKREFHCCIQIIPPGEMSKSFDSIMKTGSSLLQKGLSKNSILVSFGGGVICNLTGMLAGMLFRGIRFIEVPTSLMGQTDSSLSNKQAVNSSLGKNHFGLYHAPLFIWSDTLYLKTEPLESRKSGIVEAVKNGLISDASFLNVLEQKLGSGHHLSGQDLHDLTLQIIQSKLFILKTDPSEKKEGLILEYGHTLGHALEWNSHGGLLHGEAVSFGILFAANIAHKIGLLTREEKQYHSYLIQYILGYKSELPNGFSSAMLMQTMLADNKKTDDKVRLILLETIGRCHQREGNYLTPVSQDILLTALKDLTKE